MTRTALLDGDTGARVSRRVAYADPPYIGQAKKHYTKKAESEGRQAKEVDHVRLIEYLNTFDSWALSLSTPSLKIILPLCPDDVRIGAWVKPFCAFKPGVNPAYAWEPVLFRGSRKRSRQEATVRDWVSANITLKKGCPGAKPSGFSDWLFDLLGVAEGDEFFDLYPGSGLVSDAFAVKFGTQALTVAMDGVA